MKRTSLLQYLRKYDRYLGTALSSAEYLLIASSGKATSISLFRCIPSNPTTFLPFVALIARAPSVRSIRSPSTRNPD